MAISSDDGLDDVTRFDTETAYVQDPETLEGEVIPPGQTGEEEEEEPFEFPVADFINPELVSAFLAVPANMMARKTGEQWWRLSNEELELLGKSSTPGIKYLVEKYLSAAAGPLAGLGASLAVIYGPRVMRQARQRQTQQSKPGQPPSSQTASASSSENGAAENQPNNSEFSVPFEE